MLIKTIIFFEFYQRLQGNPASLSTKYSFVPDLGYKLRPGSHRIATTGRVVDLYIDSDGILDRHGKGQATIVLLGDV